MRKVEGGETVKEIVKMAVVAALVVLAINKIDTLHDFFMS